MIAPPTAKAQVEQLPGPFLYKIMNKALIYCRVSTDEQANEGYSLDAQERFCKKFAEDKGYKISEVFRDEGRSGTNLDRPALQDMLNKCQQEEEKISAVLVQETDRLARSTKDHLTIKAILKKADIKLISVAQPMLDDSPEGNMIDTILASVNQFQSDLNSRKTKKGMQERFDSGWWPGYSKLGYLNKEVNERRIIVDDPERWDLLKKALKTYLKGSYSAIEISDIFYEKGLVSRSGKKISNSIMISILKDPFYAGLMKWNKQEKEGKHNAMITLEEHKRILFIMSCHNKHACRRRKHNFLLRGFLYCGICDQRYTAEKHRERKNLDYYHCGSGIRKHSNEGQNIDSKEMERLVEEQFKRIEFSKSFIDLTIKKIKIFYKKRMVEIIKNKQGLLNKEAGIKKKMIIAENKLISGTLSDSGFINIRDRLDEEIKNIQKQISDMDNSHRVDIDTIREVLLLSGNIYETYKKASPGMKRLWLSLFWEGFWVKDKQIIEARPTNIVKKLLEEKSVIIINTWLPN